MTKKNIAIFGAALVLVFTIGWFMGDSSAINRVKTSLAKGSPSSVSAPAVVDPIPANPMTWSAYRASRPKTDTRMALAAKLSDYYNFDYTDLVDTYWSVEFIDIESGDSAETHGYIKKDTPDGKLLFDLLQDGKPHNLILDSKYKANDGSDTVEITKFVKEIK